MAEDKKPRPSKVEISGEIRKVLSASKDRKRK